MELELDLLQETKKRPCLRPLLLPLGQLPMPSYLLFAPLPLVVKLRALDSERVQLNLRLHPALGAEQIQAMRQRYSQHYIEAEANPSPFYDGIPQMLSSLSDRGTLLSVATGKSRKGLSRVFNAHGVGELFHSSRCADETRSKPEPDMLLEILEMHELAPRDAVMVGDTEFDLEMASRAGVDAVGVTWGAHDINRLQRHNPKICVDSVDQLSRWLHQAV